MASMKNCRECGKQFRPRTEKSAYCSRPCAKRHTRTTPAIGAVFGRWTVVGEPRDHAGRDRWIPCRCACGTEREVRQSTLRYGSSASCGCLKVEKCRARRNPRRSDGEGNVSPEWRTWKDMHRRCYEPGRRDYPFYGAKGVFVCEGWHDFDRFRDDMGERPEGLSLDRIDPHGSYTCGRCAECTRKGLPANCRWATVLVQARNKRDTVKVEWRGETRPLTEWAEVLGMNYNTLHCRLFRDGFAPEEAFTIPAVQGNNQGLRA